MNFVSSASAKSTFREWVDQLLAHLAAAEAHTGKARVKARAAALDMMRVRASATKPNAKAADHGWDAIIAAVRADTSSVRSVTKADRP